MSYVDKLRGKAAEVLAPDEQLLAAIRTMPRGTTVGMGIGGAIGAAVAGRQAGKARERAAEDSTAAGWPAERSAVGLTNRRLLVYNYTFTGKPKELIGQVPLDEVTSLDVDKGLVNKLDLTFVDGSAVQMECAKMEKVGDFESAFERAKAGA